MLGSKARIDVLERLLAERDAHLEKLEERHQMSIERLESWHATHIHRSVHEQIVTAKDGEIKRLMQRISELEERERKAAAPVVGLSAQDAYLSEVQEDEEWNKAFAASELAIREGKDHVMLAAQGALENATSEDDRQSARAFLQAVEALEPSSS